MRPVANFTLHAILAACLAAFAATGAAAGEARLTLGGSTAGAGGGGHIEVESYSWGAAKLQPGGGGGAAQKDMVLKGSTIGEHAPDGRWYPITERPALATGDEGAAASPKKPIMKPGLVNPKPMPGMAGSLRVKVKMPWPSCAEGSRYASLELSDGEQSYLLQDVTVASCGGTAEGPEESITFVYGKLGLRGWNPKVKLEVTGKAEPR